MNLVAQCAESFAGSARAWPTLFRRGGLKGGPRAASLGLARSNRCERLQRRQEEEGGKKGHAGSFSILAHQKYSGVLLRLPFV